MAGGEASPGPWWERAVCRSVGQRDSRTEGQREHGRAGQRDSRSAGQRESRTVGEQESGSAESGSAGQQDSGRGQREHVPGCRAAVRRRGRGTALCPGPGGPVVDTLLSLPWREPSCPQAGRPIPHPWRRRTRPLAPLHPPPVLPCPVPGCLARALPASGGLSGSHCQRLRASLLARRAQGLSLST